MKGLCYLSFLLLLFFFGGCSLIEPDDDEPVPPASNVVDTYSHYVVCKGVVTEKATNTPICGMRMRINKSVPSGGLMGAWYTDSVCETTTNGFGEYQMKFWYDKSHNYKLKPYSDSTLLPNPDYIPVKGFTWFYTDGEVYDVVDQAYFLDIKTQNSITVNPQVPGYAYVTLRLKQKNGYVEPMSYYLLVDGDTVKSPVIIDFPIIMNSTDFGRMLIFQGNAPRKVELHLYRTIQSNKFLSRTITPAPTKLIVEEFEF